MSHQSLRLSLLIWERLLKSLNAMFATATMGLALYAVVANFDQLRGGVGEVWRKVAQLQSVEALNVKAAFKVDQIALAAPIYSQLPADMQALLPEDILALKASWVERLLYVGDDGAHCRYETPDAGMKGYLADDQHLFADGLIAMADTSTEPAQREMKTKIARGENWTIGKPLSCYTTKLTARGRNVKTALVQFLGAGFASAATAQARRREGPALASLTP